MHSNQFKETSNSPVTLPYSRRQAELLYQISFKLSKLQLQTFDIQRPWTKRASPVPKLDVSSATVSSANWKIGDQNYYRQFGELSWPARKLTART